eukprot:s3256_g11.t1
MWTQFAWRRDESGDYVEVKLQDHGPARMVMKTLPAMWRDRKEEGMEVGEVISISQSPTQRRTSPSEESPMRKEQQILAQLVFATLDELRSAAGSSLPAEQRTALTQQLDAAALEVLDVSKSSQQFRAIRDVVQRARCAVGL